MTSKIIPQIQTSYDLEKGYQEGIEELLEKILPPDFFTDNERNKKLAFLSEHLPIIKWIENPSTLSIVLLCKHRRGAASFFYDMISRWLVPQKRLNIDLFFSSDFYLSDLISSAFTIAHIAIHVENKDQWEEIKCNMRSVDTEIRLGAVSNYHANRILEFKGLSPDGKTAMIQEKIGSLIHNRSKDYDKSIFAQMQRFLVTCKEEFKNLRDYHHISRIISILYLLRKLLKQKIEGFPSKRHFILKFLKTKLHHAEGDKNVLGMLVGLNFLQEHEVFEKNHLMSAIKSYIPTAKAIDDSFIIDRNQGSKIQTIYLEIEKEDGKDFTFDEIQLLRISMPDHLKGHIEYLMHPIFMPRNEEEVLRNIMVLSRQLKYVQDIPQMIITFDQQKGQDLSFTVIFLRVMKQDSLSISDLMKKFEKKLKVTCDRIRKVGTLRRKYPKEAAVFRVLLSSKRYLRANHSVDLYKAREDVLKEMVRVFGEIRDYNGGMIFKQNELFRALKSSLGVISKKHEFLLEKFFFALTPIEMRSIAPAEHLKTLFLMLLQFMKKEKSFYRTQDWFYKQDAKKVAMILPSDPIRRSRVMEIVGNLGFSTHQLLSFSLEGEYSCLGYLLLSDDKDKQDHFIRTISRSLDF